MMTNWKWKKTNESVWEQTNLPAWALGTGTQGFKVSGLKALFIQVIGCVSVLICDSDVSLFPGPLCKTSLIFVGE